MTLADLGDRELLTKAIARIESLEKANAVLAFKAQQAAELSTKDSSQPPEKATPRDPQTAPAAPTPAAPAPESEGEGSTPDACPNGTQEDDTIVTPDGKAVPLTCSNTFSADCLQISPHPSAH